MFDIIWQNKCVM